MTRIFFVIDKQTVFVLRKNRATASQTDIRAFSGQYVKLAVMGNKTIKSLRGMVFVC